MNHFQVSGHFCLRFGDEIVNLPNNALGARSYGLEALVSFEDGELGVPHLHGVKRGRVSGRHLGTWPGTEERHAVEGSTSSGSGAGADEEQLWQSHGALVAAFVCNTAKCKLALMQS